MARNKAHTFVAACCRGRKTAQPQTSAILRSAPIAPLPSSMSTFAAIGIAGARTSDRAKLLRHLAWRAAAAATASASSPPKPARPPSGEIIGEYFAWQSVVVSTSPRPRHDIRPFRFQSIECAQIGRGRRRSKQKRPRRTAFNLLIFLKEFWSGRMDSNPRPQPWQGPPAAYARASLCIPEPAKSLSHQGFSC